MGRRRRTGRPEVTHNPPLERARKRRRRRIRCPRRSVFRARRDVPRSPFKRVAPPALTVVSSANRRGCETDRSVRLIASYPAQMPHPLHSVNYASAKASRKKIPTIVWWFVVDGAVFFGAVIYMMVAFEQVGPYEELPPEKEALVNLWMIASLALFIILLGFLARRWMRSDRDRWRAAG